VAASISRSPAGVARKTPISQRQSYVEHLLGYVEPGKLKPLKIVVNAGNGSAGLVIDALESRLPFEFVKVHHQPMAHFPTVFPIRCCRKTVPPLRRPSWRTGRISASPGTATSTAASCSTRPGVHRGLLHRRPAGRGPAEKEPGAKIIHDPRLTWNTIDTVTQAGGIPVQSKTGHAFIKDACVPRMPYTAAR